MSYDIYGEPLRRGHCEVHPHVHEEYPCSVCLAQKQMQEPEYCDGDPDRCESSYNLGLAQQEIERLRAELKKMRWFVEELAAHDTYETEYDGRMYSICHGCGAQDEQEHSQRCLYVSVLVRSYHGRNEICPSGPHTTQGNGNEL